MTPEINNIIQLGLDRLKLQDTAVQREHKRIRLLLTLAIIDDILRENRWWRKKNDRF